MTSIGPRTVQSAQGSYDPQSGFPTQPECHVVGDPNSPDAYVSCSLPRIPATGPVVVTGPKHHPWDLPPGLPRPPLQAGPGEDGPELQAWLATHVLASRRAGTTMHLQVYEAGPIVRGADGTIANAVVLINGFPETPLTAYPAQIRALAEAGYHVIAPAQPGYPGSDQPSEGELTTAIAVREMHAMLRTMGVGKVVIVGHDWGSAAALAFATTPGAQDYVAGLGILNSVWNNSFIGALLGPDDTQRQKSQYMLILGGEGGEAYIRDNGFAALREHLRNTLVNGAYSDADIDRLVAEMKSDPGAVHGMLGYYRNLLRVPGIKLALEGHLDEARKQFADYVKANPPVPPAPFNGPVTHIFGAADPYLTMAVSRPPLAVMPKLRTLVLQNASHFVANEAPSEVNRALLALAARAQLPHA